MDTLTESELDQPDHLETFGISFEAVVLIKSKLEA